MIAFTVHYFYTCFYKIQYWSILYTTRRVNFEEFYSRHDNGYVEFRFDFLIWHTCIDIRIHFTQTERWQCIYYGDTCHLIDNANIYGLIFNVSLRKSWDVELRHTTINQSGKKCCIEILIYLVGLV